MSYHPKTRQPIPYGETVGDHVQEWYASFVQALGDELLFEVLLAGNYLDLPPLLELCAATVGLRMMSELLLFLVPSAGSKRSLRGSLLRYLGQ